VNGPGLRALLGAALLRLEDSRDELRALDAAIGDGDLGITVAGGAKAVRKALDDERPIEPAAVLRCVAKSFAKANPSTMSGLAAAALLASAKQVGDATELDRALAIQLAQTSATTIAARGGAEPGDKTILDALLPSIDALRAAPVDSAAALTAMIAAARSGVDATTGLASQRGRAAWVGERSVGHPDGGATAYLRLLESLATAWPATLDDGSTS
jgi:dihydroxyacetone kinase-like protein